MADRVPQRIQLRRTKGWRKPEGAVVVARPGRWGNPFKVGAHVLRRTGRADTGRSLYIGFDVETPAEAVDLYREWLLEDQSEKPLALRPLVGGLRGRDLACWCPLDQPCHADVLLDLANPEAL